MDELFHLLSQLRLGTAARPICERVIDMTGESIPPQQMEQEIRTLLNLHGASACADAVIAALAEIGFAGLAASPANVSEGTDAAVHVGNAPIHRESAVLGGASAPIVAQPRMRPVFDETTKSGLDIDGGICVEVGQHGARTDSEC